MGLDRSQLRRLRDLRRAAYRAISPIDAAANRLNHRDNWPPIHLRREVGPLKVFESSTATMLAQLRYEAGLGSDSRVLDVGCGVGALPLQLDLYGEWPGDYVGLDVDQRMIRWCDRKLAGPRRRFAFFDYWNATYNPSGGRRIPFPVEDGWADVILMKSVFTHMLPEDCAWYLEETARVLEPDGTALITALLFDDPAELGDGFPHEGDHYRYARAESPESSIALEKKWMDEAMAEAGLTYTYQPNRIQGPMLIRRG